VKTQTAADDKRKRLSLLFGVFRGGAFLNKKVIALENIPLINIPFEEAPGKHLETIQGVPHKSVALAM